MPRRLPGPHETRTVAPMSTNALVAAQSTLPSPRAPSLQRPASSTGLRESESTRGGLEKHQSRQANYGLRSSSGPSATTRTPAQNNTSSEPVSRSDIQLRSSDFIVELNSLRNGVTLQVLYTYFEQFGSIAQMEMWKQMTNTNGRIIFSSQPTIKIGMHYVCTESGTQKIQVGSVRRAAQTIKILSQGQFEHIPRYCRIKPLSIELGMLQEERTMMSMKTLRSVKLKDSFELEVDLEHRKLKIKFTVDMESTYEYKADIPFSSLRTLYGVRMQETWWSLVFTLPCPPLVYERRSLRSITEDLDTRLKWWDNDSWRRITDITRNPSALDTEPASLCRPEHVIDFGKWLTYRLIFDKSELPYWTAVQRRLEDHNIRFVPTEFSFVPRPETSVWDLINHPRVADNASALLGATPAFSLPWDVRYQLEVCISNGVLMEYNITKEFLAKLLELVSKSSTRRNRACELLSYIAENKKPVFNPLRIFSDRLAMSHCQQANKPDFCQYVRKVNISPTTLYALTPAPEVSNRVLRHFNKFEDRFLRVQFLDEKSKDRVFAEADKAVSEALFRRIRRVLRNGIQIGERTFRFLAYGNSQLREHGAYFFCETSSVTCDDIRSWMGDFRDIKVVAKHAARFGQCFSTTRIARNLAAGLDIQKIPDIESNGVCFSDGVGKIAPWLAEQVSRQLGMNNQDRTPSAFQFRSGGLKGLLVTWDVPRINNICVRPSQSKFPSKEKGFEIIKAAKCSSPLLNRQTITILTYLGVPNSTIVAMAREQNLQLSRAMENDNVALDLLRKSMDQNGTTSIIASMIQSGFSDEPFCAATKQLWRVWSQKQLKDKARIVVDKGAFVFGCVDETLTLRGHCKEWTNSKKRGHLPQIFLQVASVEDPSNYHVKTGICVVGRNPSLHPGDIRVVEAVDVPQLRHLRDVVVFPGRGDQDIPSMLSGGDLDGDEFFVFWDERLIPQRWNVEPMDFHGPKPVENEHGVTTEDICDFFVHYMENNTLGLIATNHLAQATLLGPNDPKCLELARLHSMAVDYMKTGIPAQMDPSLQPRRSPHFMERRSNSVHSTKAVGQIYDLVSLTTFSPNLSQPFDERVLRRYNLDKAMLHKACAIKQQYDLEMKQILNAREIGSEFEVFTAFIMSKPRVVTDYKIQEDIGWVMTTLKSTFFDRVVKEAGGRDHELLLPMVAACYQVTWEHVVLNEKAETASGDDGREMGSSRDGYNVAPLISFPWLFYQELGMIVKDIGNAELSDLPQPSGVWAGDELNVPMPHVEAMGVEAGETTRDDPETMKGEDKDTELAVEEVEETGVAVESQQSDKLEALLSMFDED